MGIRVFYPEYYTIKAKGFNSCGMKSRVKRMRKVSEAFNFKF